VVPNNLAPGEPFNALVMGTQNGQRVPLVRKLWRASGQAPIIAAASARSTEGPRHAHRPYSTARAASGTWSSSAIDHISTEDCGVEQWLSDVELPPELNEADVGWLPGPVGGNTGREMPAFTGPRMGSRDSSLSSRSTARQIMRAVQFSRTFREKVVACTRHHQQCWQAARDRPDSTERIFDAAAFKPEHVELFMAIALRLAKLNPAIAAKRLWDASHHCFDAEVHAACGFSHWEWLNRHISFGKTTQDALSDEESGSESGSDDAEVAPATFDPNRTSREGSDLARGQAQRAWNPGQHIGFDDCVREDKHRGCRRIRHKASVHSGRAVDALNCAHSKYFMTWEEQGWLRDEGSSSSGGGSGGDGDGGGAEDGGEDGGDGGGRGNRVARGRGAGRGRGGSSSRGRGRGGRGGRRGGRGGRRGGLSGRGSGLSPAEAEPATADVGTGDDANDEEDMAGADADQSPAVGVNSVAARLQRACTALQRACCETDCAPGEPKRPRIFCPGCKRERDGCSGWYHEACYWKRHCSVLRE
jgi:uncharacterized membrane protein YgcG